MIVVCYVCVGQYLVVVVDGGDVIVVVGVVVECDEFVEYVVVVDYQFGVFVGEFFVLWFVIDCGMVDEVVVVVDLGWVVDVVMGVYYGVGIDFNIGVNQGEGVYLDIVGQVSSWVDDGGGVDSWCVVSYCCFQWISFWCWYI